MVGSIGVGLGGVPGSTILILILVAIFFCFPPMYGYLLLLCLQLYIHIYKSQVKDFVESIHDGAYLYKVAKRIVAGV